MIDPKAVADGLAGRMYVPKVHRKWLEQRIQELSKDHLCEMLNAFAALGLKFNLHFDPRDAWTAQIIPTGDGAPAPMLGRGATAEAATEKVRQEFSAIIAPGSPSVDATETK